MVSAISLNDVYLWPPVLLEQGKTKLLEMYMEAK